MVGHAVLGALFTWTRATATGLDMALGLIAQIFVSMMGTFGIGFLPLRGQYWFWTGNYGSTLKSGLVVLLALVVNACFIYVRSAPEAVRVLLRSGGALLAGGVGPGLGGARGGFAV